MVTRKRMILAGAAVAGLSAVGVGGLSLATVSAATGTGSSDSGNGQSSLVDKIASKFNLNKSDVQAVFDQDRSAHQAEREAKQQEMLSQAVKDGKLTQAQADHVTQAVKEMKDLLGDKRPDQLDDATKQQLKAKADALRQWAKDNNIDMRYMGGMMMGHGRGGMGMGGPGANKGADTSTKTSDGGSSN